jgi:hypothetical protein
MPVSFEFLRGIIGVIGIGCAYMTGRSLALVRKGAQKQSRLYAWVFRTAVCLIAVGLRHRIDIAAIAIWSLAVIAFALGLWENSREKKEEDLSQSMFPHDDE